MKQLLIVILILSLLTTAVMGAEAPNDSPTTNLQEIEYKQLLLEQHAKTQAFIKQELAQRDAQLEKKVVSMVDENFQMLDQRIDGFIRNATFKFGMAFISGLVLGGCILMLINFQLRRKRAIKKTLQNHNLQEEKMVLSGDTLIKVKEQTERVEDLMEEAPTPTTKNVVAPQKRVMAKKGTSISPISLSEQTIAPMGDTE